MKINRIVKVLMFCAAAAALGGASLAQAAEYHLNGDKSSIRFKANPRFGGGSGRFRRFDMAADVDPVNLDKSRFTVNVEIASIDTGITKRDTHLRSPDFFDAEKFPQAQFIVREILPLSDNRYKAFGSLTIRGVNKEMELLVTVRESDGKTLAFEGETVINRKEFGINYQSRMNPIADPVKIFFDITLNR